MVLFCKYLIGGIPFSFSIFRCELNFCVWCFTNVVWLLCFPGGPLSPFENNWHLKPEYKNHQRRKQLANKLSRNLFILGLANFLFAPIIFLWQILYSFFRYAEVSCAPWITCLKWSKNSHLEWKFIHCAFVVSHNRWWNENPVFLAPGCGHTTPVCTLDTSMN